MNKLSHWHNEGSAIRNEDNNWVGMARDSREAKVISLHYNIAIDFFLTKESDTRTKNVTGDSALSVPSIRGKARPVS